MKLFYYHFDGMNPVGAVAIAAANTVEEAAQLFNEKLSEDFPQEIDIEQIEEFDISKPNCEILLDGDY